MQTVLSCNIYAAFLAARVPPTDSSLPPFFDYTDPFSLIHCLSRSVRSICRLSSALFWIAHAMSARRVLFLRRNPKLMVNYIRPATELGLSREHEGSFLVYGTRRHVASPPTPWRGNEQPARLAWGRVSVTDMLRHHSLLPRVRTKSFAYERSSRSREGGHYRRVRLNNEIVAHFELVLSMILMVCSPFVEHHYFHVKAITVQIIKSNIIMHIACMNDLGKCINVQNILV